MIKQGTLTADIIKSKLLQNPHLKGEPQGTLSQVIRYYDHRRESRVVIHQYLRPDGTIGASGKPDPKRLWIEDVIYLSTP
jgi:hypothetical protein